MAGPRYWHPRLREAGEYLSRHGGAEGRDLIAALSRRRTIVAFAPIQGGFTLNALNVLLIESKLKPGALSDVALVLAHEACHVAQGFWTDSIAQELAAYQVEGRLAGRLAETAPDFARETGTGRWALRWAEPDSQSLSLDDAQRLLSRIPGPAGRLYACLPREQPRGLAAVRPALRQIAALTEPPIMAVVGRVWQARISPPGPLP